MKKINSFILFGAAVFAFAACSNETQIENAPKNNGPVYETLSVKVGNEATTRVSLATDATTAAFETGDQIAVWTEAGSFQTCAVDAYGKISVDISGGVRSNYAVYYNGDPLSFTPTFDGTALTITLPSEYDYDDVKGDKNPVPMVAKNVAGDAADMTFYAVCALARITLTGIPATANKLVVNFDQDVTGEFTVDAAGSDHPSIASTGLAASSVTINLTPGTDYTGAVINIPVPLTFKGLEASAYIEAKKDNKLIDEQTTIFGSTWVPARAKGKKATVNFTPSVYSMFFAKGNLYTEGGTLKIASDWYSNIYITGYDASYTSGSYSAGNRSHFNFNELSAMMTDGSATSTSGFGWAIASTNVGSFEEHFVIINFTGYRVPTQAEWEAATTGSSRPGAYLSDDGGTSYSPGWKFLKVLVTGMGVNGITNSACNGYEAGSDYLAGLLLFPDNVMITGTFTALGVPNAVDVDYPINTITKDNLDALITAGCTFLPAAGRYSSDSFGLMGVNGGYWASTQSTDGNGYNLNFYNEGTGTNNRVNPGSAGGKSSAFRSVRLVKK